MKKQIKKSLSLFLAVLMLLTCWVWVAPQKAEAGTATPYYVKLVSNVTDTGNESGSDLTITYKDTNGTGDTGTMYVEWGQRALEGNDVVLWEGSINGFPTNVQFRMYLDSTRSERHENFRLYVGASAETCTTNVLPSDNYGFSGSSNTFSKATTTSYYPRFTTPTGVAAIETSVTKLANGANTTATASITGGRDQYGVNWAAALPTSGFTYSIKDANGATVSTTYASVSGAGSTATVTLRDDVQKLFPNTKTGTLYLHATYGGTTVTSNIRINNPEYTMTFDANGGKIGADENSAADTVTMGGTDSKMYYASVIGESPKYRTKAGKAFMGFYDYKNTDATGLTASFSGTKFEDKVTTVGDTGDKTWYAAWQSAPITATFLTADNQLIGTLEGRYDNNMAATNMYNGIDGINAALKAAYTGSSIQFDANNAPIYTDGSTTYNFSHWKIIKAYSESVVDGDQTTTLQGDVTFQAVYTKADAATYTVSFYDGNGNVLSTKSDYSYRDDVILPATEPTKAQDDRYDYEFVGWAKNIGKNFYTVDSENKDENGAVISYIEKDADEFTVRGDASYVPVFRMTPREYSVTFNYVVDGGATASLTVDGYNWHDGITLPESIKDNYTYDGFRYYIDGWNVGNNTAKTQLDNIAVEGNMTLTATYGAGEPARYTINFYDRDGNLLNGDANIYEHNNTVTAPEVDVTIDTDDILYTFEGFKDKSGNVYSQTATADAEYYAEYSAKYYADVAFYNEGIEIYRLDGKENGLFIGETIPAYDEGTYGLPEKAEDVVGTYSFTGWADGAGNAVVPGTDVFEGDIYLNAQYSTEYKEYTVIFQNDDGTEISKKTYHYGDVIAVPEEKPTKQSDETYSYEFRAWSPDVSEVCYGDVTYTATYRRSYNYYKVTWLKDDKSIASSTNYIYNEKIHANPTPDPVVLGDAGEGYTWVLDQWIMCDANGNDILDGSGNKIAFVRGDRMGTENLYFYPTYKREANILTVRFLKADGSYIGNLKIPYGGTIGEEAVEYEKAAIIEADDTYHYDFNEWVYQTTGATVGTITENCSVIATHTPVQHNKVIFNVVKEPTCTETGLVDKKCESDSCGLVDYNVVEPVIPDTSAPDGQVYIGSSKWTSNDYRNGINYDDVVYAGPSTNIIINASDTNQRSNPWNLNGSITRRVGKIEYYISETVISDPTTIHSWQTAFDYADAYSDVLTDAILGAGLTRAQYDALPDEATAKQEILATVAAIMATYEANATGILENLNLTNGKEYIIYAKLSDREVSGSSNVSYLSTGKFHYGSAAPEVTFSGEGYGTKFCAEATVYVTDDLDGFKVLVDGEEVALTDGKYTTTEKGVHIVSVTDKSGNTTTKSFEIKGAHTYRNYTVAATCDKAGSRYDLCTLCGVKANIVVIDAHGHNFATFAETAATCVVDGYRIYTCSYGCGEKLTIKWNSSAADIAKVKDLEADDIAYLKATGTHTYAKVTDADGKDTAEDAWVIDKAATCVAAGSKHKDCTVCGARVIEEIPADANAHKFYRAKVEEGNEPTCTEEGLKTKVCKYCGTKVDDEILPALGHTEGEYRVITEATCTEDGSKILTCAVCNVDIGEAEFNDKDEFIGFNGEAVVIEKLGHKLVFSHVVEPTDTEQGYSVYKCARAGCDYTENKDYFDKAEEYTVTFMNGDITVLSDKWTKGETITALDVAEPTKAADENYRYNFAYWAARTGEGTDESPYIYTEVDFPIEVTADATYYAVFESKAVNYTITYYKEDGTTQYRKVGYLRNGETYDVAEGPAKSSDKENSYTFAGWKDMNGTEVYKDEVTINGADIKLVATYTETKLQYAVTYAYSASNTIDTFLVEAGTAARDCSVVPEKAPESKYHYKFSGWNRAEQLKAVYSNIYTTPNFTSVEHTFTKETVSEATCTSNLIEKFTCECGYSYTAEIEGTVLDHDWSDPVYDEATGKYVKTCQRENCGATTSENVTFTVTYYKDDTVYTHSYNVVWGTSLADVLPTAPTKNKDDANIYTFSGWALKGSTEIINPEDITVKENIDLVAVFTAADRLYTVVFAYDANNTIKTYRDTKFADISTALYSGATPAKNFDDTNHYVFNGWKDASSHTSGDIVTYYAVFDSVAHERNADVTAATCETGEGTVYSCSCGYRSAVIETSKPLGHVLVEKAGTRIEPTDGKNGSVVLECTRSGCDYEIKQELVWEDPTADLVKITINVKDTNGKPVSGATVALYQNGNWVAQDITNGNGQVTFMVAPGKYTVVITGVSNANDQQSEITVNNDGSISGNIPQISIRTCGCACHNDNLWGKIFRFFHSIIKMITGEFKCCKDPSDLY